MSEVNEERSAAGVTNEPPRPALETCPSCGTSLELELDAFSRDYALEAAAQLLETRASIFPFDQVGEWQRRTLVDAAAAIRALKSDQ